MRRRTVLAAAGLGTLPLAGCLSTGDDETDPNTSNDDSETPTESDDRQYVECSREVIPYDMFPAEIQAELDAALDGSYEADRVSLAEAMDVDASYISVGETYYDPSVTVDADRERLTLEPVEPKALPNPRPVSVEQLRDGERTVTVTLTAEDGTVLVDETRSLSPGGEVEFGETRRVGSHELRVTVMDGEETEAELVETVIVDESQFDVLVVVETDEVYVTGAVADLGICLFEPDEGTG